MYVRAEMGMSEDYYTVVSTVFMDASLGPWNAKEGIMVVILEMKCLKMVRGVWWVSCVRNDTKRGVAVRVTEKAGHGILKWFKPREKTNEYRLTNRINVLKMEGIRGREG